MSEEKVKLICDNKKAFHNYHIEERWEAGLVLQGTEVKALRAGKANLRDAYAHFKNSELFLLNCHISPYEMGNRENHDPLRTRKLLLHYEEIKKLTLKLERQGYSLIPTKMYFKKGKAKIELGLGKSKKSFDKREATKEKEAQRELARVVKKNQR